MMGVDCEVTEETRDSRVKRDHFGGQKPHITYLMPMVTT